ncbi:uridine kinase family-domain-containing protein [Zopfochytrium polystomum]|nr:uridine kinase family-domain-containing protein [Zopfochytrium polystomum]
MPPSSPSSPASPGTAASADEKAARRGSGALSNFFQRLGSGGGSAAGKGSRKGSQSPGRSASQDSIPADDKRDEPAARAPHVSPDRSVSELSINEPPLVVHKAESNAAGDLAESHHRPFFIAISGGAASGKKEVCSMIVDKLKSTEARKVAIVKLESFYRELTPEDRVRVDAGTYNFDHPDAVDFKLLETCLVDLAAGKDFSVPVWDFQTLKRLPSTTPTLHHPDIVFVIGPLVLYKKRVRDFFNLRAFIDVLLHLGIFLSKNGDTPASALREARFPGRRIELRFPPSELTLFQVS